MEKGLGVPRNLDVDNNVDPIKKSGEGTIEKSSDNDGDNISDEYWHYYAPNFFENEEVVIEINLYNLDNDVIMSEERVFYLNNPPTIGAVLATNNVDTTNGNWTKKGTYEVRVKARDQYGAESEWSDPLIVSMPKIKSIKVFNPWVSRLIEHFPILELLI